MNNTSQQKVDLNKPRILHVQICCTVNTMSSLVPRKKSEGSSPASGLTSWAVHEECFVSKEAKVQVFLWAYIFFRICHNSIPAAHSFRREFQRDTVTQSREQRSEVRLQETNTFRCQLHTNYRLQELV
jgi:hypothetical protein